MSGSMIVEFWLALASGQPFPMKRIVRLSMTSAQYAVAEGTATPEQRKIANKQRRFIVVKTPYYPTVEDMKEAVDWLANRGQAAARAREGAACAHADDELGPEPDPRRERGAVGGP